MIFKEEFYWKMVDVVATGFTKVVGHGSEIWKMCSRDKLASSACMLLFRTKDEEPVNPSPDGNELISMIHRTFVNFSTTKRYDNLIKLGKWLETCS